MHACADGTNCACDARHQSSERSIHQQTKIPKRRDARGQRAFDKVISLKKIFSILLQDNFPFFSKRFLKFESANRLIIKTHPANRAHGTYAGFLKPHSLPPPDFTSTTQSNSKGDALCKTGCISPSSHVLPSCRAMPSRKRHPLRGKARRNPSSKWNPT